MEGNFVQAIFVEGRIFRKMNNPWDAPFNQINFKRFSIPTSSTEKFPSGVCPALEKHCAFIASGLPALCADDNAAWLCRHPKSEKGEPEIPFFTLS